MATWRDIYCFIFEEVTLFDCDQDFDRFEKVIHPININPSYSSDEVYEILIDPTLSEFQRIDELDCYLRDKY